METIQIPSLNMMLRHFQQLDSYIWYCDLLKQYARSPYLVHGMTVPCFVAKMFVAHQRQDPLFGMFELKKFFQQIVTTTFFQTLETPGDRILENRRLIHEDTPTFDNKTIKELETKYSKLLKIMTQHEKIIKSIRQHQQESLKLQEQMNQLRSKLRPFLASLPDKDGLVASTICLIKCAVLKNKEKRATESYLSAVEKLKSLIETEKEIRHNIHQMSAQIRETVINTATNSMDKAIGDMAYVVRGITHRGFRRTLDQLWEVDSESVVHKLYNACSTTYTTPIPEEFIAGTRSSEIIPKVKKSQQELKNPFEDEVDAAFDDCFLDKSGGVEIVVKKNLPRPTGARYNIFGVREDSDVKMKLCLLNNTIGFGWSKRSLLSKKIWGYFYTTEHGEL